MHDKASAELALQFLELNYWLIGQEVDLGRMSSAKLDSIKQYNPKSWAFRTAAWLANQGFYLSTWSLWEYYSKSVCGDMPNKVGDKRPDGTKKSHVEWVRDTLADNGSTFAEYDWFVCGNALRNLFAHKGGRVVGTRDENAWLQVKTVFPDMELSPEKYIDLQADHAITLAWKVKEFISDPARADN